MRLKILMFALLSAAAAPATSLEPIETFTAAPAYVTPTISPAGGYIAALTTRGDKDYVWITPVAEGGPKAIAIPFTDLTPEDWFWVNEDWLVVRARAMLTRDGKGVSVTRLFAISRATMTVTQLTREATARNGGEVVWTAKDGSARILMTDWAIGLNGYGPSVDEVDLTTGAHKTIVPAQKGIRRYIADADGVVRVGLGSGGDYARLVYRDRADEPFAMVDKADMTDDEDDGLTVPGVLLPEPGQSLVLSRHEGFRSVYRYDLRRQRFGERLFAVPGYDVRRITSNAAGDGAAAYRWVADREQTQWVDPAFSQVQADLDRVTGIGNARIDSWTRDAKAFVVQVADPDQAGAYYLYDSGAGRLKLLSPIRPSLGAKRVGSSRMVRYTARDGLEISAVLTVPVDRPAHTLPLVVLPHGGPAVRDSLGWDATAHFLADRGYAVVRPNYRGSSGFGAAFTGRGLNQFGRAMQDDLIDAIAYLAEQGIIDRKRVCIVGRGFGGFMAITAAVRDAGSYRCAVSLNGISDLGDQLWTVQNASKEERSEAKGDIGAPIRRAADFTTPLLLVHGALPSPVPVDQSRSLAAALQRAGKVHRYVELPQADTWLSREADRIRYFQELEAFLHQYNPA